MNVLTLLASSRADGNTDAILGWAEGARPNLERSVPQSTKGEVL